MRIKPLELISIILFFSMTAFGQDSLHGQTFFKLTDISGELKLSGFYREQDITRYYLKDHQQSWMISGGVILNAKSYFYHPNFLQVDVGLEYSPEQTSDLYLTIPDEGEIRTLKKLDVYATLFQKKLITLTGFANISETYSNRELLSSTIKTNSKTFGGYLFFKSPALPTTISYTQGSMVQDEIQTTRLFAYDSKDLEGRITKSFSRFDRNELILSHNEFKRVERNLFEVSNNINELFLNNDIYFDRKERNRFHSMINVADQAGYDSLQRFQAFETLTLKLPGKLDVIGNYNYYNVVRPIQTIKQNTYRGMLRHKLFESLYSDIFYEYNDVKQTTFEQKDTRMGLDLDYVKKIPGGTLNLSYKYMTQKMENLGEAGTLQTMHEAYVLVDGQIILLKRPYVNIASIQVWDSTGTALYQLGPDYLLVTLGNYIQIQRVPGGLIKNGSTVYLNYLSDIPGNYEYTMKNEYYSAGVSLFKRFLNLYYRHQKQDYFNMQNTDAVTLNYFTQQIYGIRLEYKTLNGGVEYDDNNSSILPYTNLRYFVNLQGTYRIKWMYCLNGNVSNYELLAENLKQQYADVNAQISYALTPFMKINFDAGYRQQVGQGIDLTLLNARLEYSFNNQKFYYTIGLQTYKKDYLDGMEVDNYRGGYFRIGRRF